MAHHNGWVRCPHSESARVPRAMIWDGEQREYCPQCGNRFILVIRSRRIVDVRSVNGS